LRDVTLDMLGELVSGVDQESYIKGKFVIQENQRLQQACDALQQGDIQELGKQMFLAHQALSEEYQVSCPELDFLVEKVREHPGVNGARMMGGGFGGCTINIIKKGYGEKLLESLAPAYKNQF